MFSIRGGVSLAWSCESVSLKQKFAFVVRLFLVK